MCSSVACSSGGRNSCSGGSSSRIVDGEPGHRLEDALEVGLLHRQQPLERAQATVQVVGEDHLADDGEPLLGHEHVLRPAEADALRAELAGAGGVLRRVGVRPHLQPADVVGPAEHGLEVLVQLRRDELDGADDDAARCRHRS